MNKIIPSDREHFLNLYRLYDIARKKWESIPSSEKLESVVETYIRNENAIIHKHGFVTFNNKGQVGQLENLFVETKNRGEGLGTKLILSAELELLNRGCLSAFLFNSLSNSQINQLYSKLGYDLVETGREVYKFTKKL